MFEYILDKVVGNIDIQYVKGRRALNLKEHLVCLIVIAFFAVCGGFLVNIHRVSSDHVEIAILVAAMFLFISSGAAFSFILLPLSFLTIYDERRVNSIIIYEVWLASLVLFTVLILIKRLFLI